MHYCTAHFTQAEVGAPVVLGQLQTGWRGVVVSNTITKPNYHIVKVVSADEKVVVIKGYTYDPSPIMFHMGFEPTAQGNVPTALKAVNYNQHSGLVTTTKTIAADTYCQRRSGQNTVVTFEQD